MPTVRFKGEYSHITLTTPRLKIFRPKINKAYFATAKIEEVTTTSTTETVQETYVVAGGDTLSKIASKKGTTVDAIIESDTKLTQTNKDKLKVGQKITLPSTVATTETNKKITFEKVNEGILDSELYLVVETEGFQGYSLYFNIKQGKEKGIEEKDGLITFKDENDNYSTKGEVKVGALCEKHYMNVDDYAETAIYKLQIDHNAKTIKEAWQKALEGKDKKTPLYLLVEGHTVPGQEEININYYGDSEGGEIRGEAIKNLWLDSDGNWFELKSNSTLEYNIYHDGRIEKTKEKEPKKVLYNYFDSNNNKHFLGEAKIERTKKHIKKDIVSSSESFVLLAYSKDIKSYSSKNIKFKFSTWNSDSQRWYINPDCFAGLLGAMIEESIEDLGFNGFSIKNGNTAGGSSSHINGEKGDLRYLSINKNGQKTVLQDNHFDYERQVKFNNALFKFGWGVTSKMYSENFEREIEKEVLDKKTKNKIIQKVKTNTLLPHTKHMKKTTGGVKYRHHHHLHLTGFDFSKIKKI